MPELILCSCSDLAVESGVLVSLFAGEWTPAIQLGDKTPAM